MYRQGTTLVRRETNSYIYQLLRRASLAFGLARAQHAIDITARTCPFGPCAFVYLTVDLPLTREVR